MGNQSVEDSKAHNQIRIPDGPPRDTIVDRVWKGMIVSIAVIIALLAVGAAFDAYAFRVIRGSMTIPTLIASLCTLGIIRIAIELAGQWGFDKLSRANSVIRNALYLLFILAALAMGLLLRHLIRFLY